MTREVTSRVRDSFLILLTLVAPAWASTLLVPASLLPTLKTNWCPHFFCLHYYYLITRQKNVTFGCRQPFQGDDSDIHPRGDIMHTSPSRLFASVNRHVCLLPPPIYRVSRLVLQELEWVFLPSHTSKYINVNLDKTVQVELKYSGVWG